MMGQLLLPTCDLWAQGRGRKGAREEEAQVGGSSQKCAKSCKVLSSQSGKHHSQSAAHRWSPGAEQQADVTVPAPGTQQGRSRLLTIYRGQLIFKGGGLNSPASVGLWSRAQDPRWPFIVAPSCHPTALPYYILSPSSGPGCGRSETAGWRSGGPSRQPRLPACSGS